MPFPDLRAFKRCAGTTSGRYGSLLTRCAAPFLLLLLVVGNLGTIWHLYQRTEALHRAFPLQGSALEAETIKAFRQIYTENVVHVVQDRGIELTHDPQRHSRAIPLPATMTNMIGVKLNEFRPGAHLRLYSDYPFPWQRDGGPRDDFERDALVALRARPDAPFHRFEDFEGRPSLRYAVADRMQASCVACHNSHAESPKRDWQVGDVRGVLEFIRPLDQEVAAGSGAFRSDLVFTVAMSGLGLGGLLVVLYWLRLSSKALASGAARTKAMLESSMDGVVTIDHNGSVLEFSPAAEQLFGYERAKVVGRTIAELSVPRPMREAHERGLAQYLATGEGPILGKRIEVQAQRADGTEFPIELTVNAIRRTGPPVFTAYLRDLTERKRAEGELQAANQQLVETARHAAMAEMATGVLHNVGNVLNSVNVAAALAADHLRHSKVDQLTRAVALFDHDVNDLGRFLTQDPKGKQLPGFLKLVAQHLANERDAVLVELDSLTTKVDHVKTIVATQQSHAGVSGVIEAFEVSTMLDDALKLNSPSFERHGITVERHFADLPEILIDKHRVMQILFNLVKNARESLLEAPRDARRLVLRTYVDDERLRIEIEDSGVGIASENLNRVLSHGFTTKKSGHGFGLHSCANAAKEMGGSLTVFSDGPGTGATFTLDLPFAPAEALV